MGVVCADSIKVRFYMPRCLESMNTTVAPVTTTSASESWHDTEVGHHVSIVTYLITYTWIGISFLFYVKPDAAWSNWSSSKKIPFCYGKLRTYFYLRWWVQLTFGLFGLLPLYFFFFDYVLCCCTSQDQARHRFKMSNVLWHRQQIFAKADEVKQRQTRNQIMPSGEEAETTFPEGTMFVMKDGRLVPVAKSVRANELPSAVKQLRL